jgi:hypothetical protein
MQAVVVAGFGKPAQAAQVAQVEVAPEEQTAEAMAPVVLPTQDQAVEVVVVLLHSRQAVATEDREL